MFPESSITRMPQSQMDEVDPPTPEGCIQDRPPEGSWLPSILHSGRLYAGDRRGQDECIWETCIRDKEVVSTGPHPDTLYQSFSLRHFGRPL